MRRLVLGLCLLLGCGELGLGNGTPGVDARGSGSGGDGGGGDTADAVVCVNDTSPTCWPTVTDRVPHGSLTMGTGRFGYQPMPDEVPIEWGFQDGFMFVLSARMTGFEAGIPGCILDQRNPHTRIRAFFDDTNVPLTTGPACPFRTPYKIMETGAYELIQEVGVVFDTCWRSDRLIGKRIRIEGELLDDNGNYATETRVVTALAPVSPGYPMDTNSAPCPP